MSNDIVRLNLEITIPKKWVNKFLQMLDCMRWCGRAGASRCIGFYADGDGDFRPFNFKVDGEEVESNIKWHEFDHSWHPADNNDVPPPFKTKRSGVDFFFDRG